MYYAVWMIVDYAQSSITSDLEHVEVCLSAFDSSYNPSLHASTSSLQLLLFPSIFSFQFFFLPIGSIRLSGNNMKLFMFAVQERNQQVPEENRQGRSSDCSSADRFVEED